MMTDFGFITGVGVADTSKQYAVDSKAMRKVDSGSDIAIVFEQQSAFGAELTIEGRILIKLH